MHRALATLAVAAALFAPDAHAQKARKPARLSDYTRGPGTEEACPDRETFLAEFASTDCPPLWGDSGKAVSVVFHQSTGGISATHSIDGRSATMSAPTCAALVRDVVSAITFQIDPCVLPIPAPLIQSVSPLSAVRGERSELTISGAAFAEGATVTISGDVAVAATRVVDATTIEVTVDVPGDATLDARDVTVKNPLGRPAKRKNAFAIVSAPAPRLAAVKPDHAAKGERVRLVVEGAGFLDGAKASFDASGHDIVVVESSVISPTTMLVDLLVAESPADFRRHELTVTNPLGERPTAILPDAFSVTDTVPRIAALSPALGIQGARVTVRVSGSGFRPDATAHISGEGIDVTNLGTTFDGDGQLLLALELGGDAVPGVRTVDVRNGVGLSRSEPFAGFTVDRHVVAALSEHQYRFFAGMEGGYSYWSGGRNGPDEHYQASAISGDLVAGGDRAIGRGYTLDVLVTGYGASKRDRKSYTEEQQAEGKPAEEFVTHTISATALRAAIHSDTVDTGVSLGLIAGGFEESGCRHDRTGLRNWATPLCEDVQQWAAFPTFSVRLGPLRGPYATLGFLDGRSLAGSVAHIGVGGAFPHDVRAELDAVASTEGVGPRLAVSVPWKKRFVITPTISGGFLYDTFVITDPGRDSFWFRTGVTFGVLQ